MDVTVFDGDALIGHASLTNLDPPMGVATGAFTPSELYVRTAHANVIDGDFVGERSDHFRILSAQHGEIESSGIAILDWPTLGEVELYVLGITRPDYDTLFSDHPHFRAYWSQD